ncbi:uncharacterized protein METZ01_LOCUS405208, partial [marine metagenome]
ARVSLCAKNMEAKRGRCPRGWSSSPMARRPARSWGRVPMAPGCPPQRGGRSRSNPWRPGQLP